MVKIRVRVRVRVRARSDPVCKGSRTPPEYSNRRSGLGFRVQG